MKPENKVYKATILKKDATIRSAYKEIDRLRLIVQELSSKLANQELANERLRQSMGSAIQVKTPVETVKPQDEIILIRGVA